MSDRKIHVMLFWWILYNRCQAKSSRSPTSLWQKWSTCFTDSARYKVHC